MSEELRSAGIKKAARWLLEHADELHLDGACGENGITVTIATNGFNTNVNVEQGIYFHNRDCNCAEESKPTGTGIERFLCNNLDLMSKTFVALEGMRQSTNELSAEIAELKDAVASIH